MRLRDLVLVFALTLASTASADPPAERVRAVHIFKRFADQLSACGANNACLRRDTDDSLHWTTPSGVDVNLSAGTPTILPTRIDFTSVNSTGFTSVLSSGTVRLARGPSNVFRTAQPFDRLWEDRSDAGGPGTWTWGSYTNLVSPDDFVTGWTVQNGAIVTPQGASTADGPDGVLQSAARVADHNGAAMAGIYRQPGAVGDLFGSLWIKDAVGDVPTLPGCLMIDDGGTAGGDFGSGSSWRRVEGFGNSPGGTEFLSIYPAGRRLGPIDSPAGVGAEDVYGLQFLNQPCSLPLAGGTVGNAWIALSSASCQGIVASNGDFVVTGTFLVKYSKLAAPNFTAFVGMSADGGVALRYTASSYSWILSVRGVPVLTAYAAMGPYNSEVRFVAAYKPSTGEAVLRIFLAGALEQYLYPSYGTGAEATGIATGAPLSPLTSFYLGSESGTAGFLNAMWSSFQANWSGQAVDLNYKPEIIVLGDSIMSWATNSGLSPNYLPAALLYTLAQSRSRVGIVSLAQSGELIEAQQAKFSASVYSDPNGQGVNVRAVIIQLGFNNGGTGDTASQTIAKLQSLVNTVAAALPSAKIVIGRITPGNGNGGLTWWNAVNQAIDGSGGTPITGVHARVSDNSRLLDANPNGPTDVLATPYQSDQNHPNNSGRAVMMAPYVTALTSLGIFP